MYNDLKMSKMLSACMIVKNEERILKKTLPALSGTVDELIVVDTGSTDGTIEIAKSFGAAIFNFHWINDFAAARNESIKHATADWVMWIDADEAMKKEDILKLKTILKDTKENGVAIPLFECKEGEYGSNVFYYRLKIFRNRMGYHFIRPINEELVDREGKNVPGKVISDIPIYHWGGTVAISSEMLKKKKERNIGMLRESLKKDPNDAFHHFLLANNLREAGDLKNAIDEYGSAADLLKAGALASSAMTKRASIQFGLKDNDGAYASAKKAAALDPRNAEAYNIIGAIYLDIKNYDKAIEVLSYSSKLPVPQSIEISIDLNQYTFMPNYLLGNAYLLKGDKANALPALEKAYSYDPNEPLKKIIDNIKSSK